MNANGVMSKSMPWLFSMSLMAILPLMEAFLVVGSKSPSCGVESCMMLKDLLRLLELPLVEVFALTSVPPRGDGADLPQS